MKEILLHLIAKRTLVERGQAISCPIPQDIVVPTNVQTSGPRISLLRCG